MIEEIGKFDEALDSLEDWDLFVRLAVVKPYSIKHVDQVLGEYHYFLQKTEKTVENSRFPEEAILDYFGIGEISNNEKIIRDKIQKKLFH